MGSATTYRSHRLKLYAIVTLSVFFIDLVSAHSQMSHGHGGAHAHLHHIRAHGDRNREGIHTESLEGYSTFSAREEPLNGQLFRRDGVSGQTGT